MKRPQSDSTELIDNQIFLKYHLYAGLLMTLNSHISVKSANLLYLNLQIFSLRLSITLFHLHKSTSSCWIGIKLVRHNISWCSKWKYKRILNENFKKFSSFNWLPGFFFLSRQALDLHPMDFNGRADPYLIVKCGRDKVVDKEHKIDNSLNPVFGR